jgi:hypothetical protein
VGGHGPDYVPRRAPAATARSPLPRAGSGLGGQRRRLLLRVRNQEDDGARLPVRVSPSRPRDAPPRQSGGPARASGRRPGGWLVPERSSAGNPAGLRRGRVWGLAGEGPHRRRRRWRARPAPPVAPASGVAGPGEAARRGGRCGARSRALWRAGAGRPDRTGALHALLCFRRRLGDAPAFDQTMRDLRARAEREVPLARPQGGENQGSMCSTAAVRRRLKRVVCRPATRT